MGLKNGGETSGLTYVHGTLFAANQLGGVNGLGSLISARLRNDKVRTLYSLQGGLLGAFPEFPPVYQNGILYGTTDGFYSNGKQGDDGLVFKYDLVSRQWTVLHSFEYDNDAISPGALVYHDGFLYGTGLNGGGMGCLGGDGCGIIFQHKYQDRCRIYSV